MRKFYSKVLIAFIGVLIIIAVFEYLSMTESWRNVIARWTNSEDYITTNNGSEEIIPYIEKLQINDGSSILILGDSVCRQMFSGLQKYNSDVCIMGSNAAISMTGQYIFAYEYLKAHPQATEMYLIVLPNSLRSTFDTTWGYQYTVMPYVLTNTINLLEDTTIEKMREVYGAFFINRKIVECIDKSALNRKLYLNLLSKYGKSYVQESEFELADIYVKKIYELCEENNVQLHLLPCPVAEGKKQDMENLGLEYKKTWMYTVFPDYFDKILYYPDEEARDGIHFGGYYETQEQFNIKIRKMLDGEILQDYFCFE